MASQLEEDISSALDAVLADLDYEHSVWDSVKNMGSPPSLAYLDRRMHMHGQRSEYRDGLKHWICPVCWHNYPPVANLLVDLPLDDCLYCGIEVNERTFLK
uniref:Uncharacterized protein n=1 Tax=Arundo donax TaxID=35708 RepID=A0A0A9DGC8_ARUDO